MRVGLIGVVACTGVGLQVSASATPLVVPMSCINRATHGTPTVVIQALAVLRVEVGMSKAELASASC